MNEINRGRRREEKKYEYVEKQMFARFLPAANNKRIIQRNRIKRARSVRPEMTVRGSSCPLACTPPRDRNQLNAVGFSSRDRGQEVSPGGWPGIPEIFYWSPRRKG